MQARITQRRLFRGHAARLATLAFPVAALFAASGAGNSWYPHVVLFDCSAEVRTARLCGTRGQPELATPRMDSWAAYLRGQADALGLPIVDTTKLTIEEAAQQLQELVRRLENSNAPQ